MSGAGALDSAAEHRRLFAAAARHGVTADILRDRAAVRGWGGSLRALSPQQKRELRWEMEDKERAGCSAATGGDKGGGLSEKYLPFRRKIAPERRKMMSKISCMLAEAGRSWNYADGLAVQMFDCDRVEWLTDARLHALTAALAKDQTRRHKAPKRG